jgi:hypothetical protein
VCLQLPPPTADPPPPSPPFLSLLQDWLDERERAVKEAQRAQRKARIGAFRELLEAST